MEDKENTSSSYKKLISQEETTEDDLPLHSNLEQQVTMSSLRPDFTLKHYRLLTGSLAVLAVILLAVDIGLGVYYNKLTGYGNTVKDISSEIAKLQVSYNAAVQSRDEALKQLAVQRGQQQVTKWESTHLTIRIKNYGDLIQKTQMEIAMLNANLPMIREGCKHCLPSWIFLSSSCFYFPFYENSYSTWQEARQVCQRQGGDLAAIDSREKQMAVIQLINNKRNPSSSLYLSGFWIGLTDAEEEGVWKWLDGTRLNEGFWRVGEPNNQNNENCAAIYPNTNPFMTWNDAPCTFRLKGICEMAPRSMG